MKQPLISGSDEGSRNRNADPFYTVKTKLASHLLAVENQYQLWKKSLNAAGPTGSQELFARDKELKRQLRDIQPGIAMLEEVLKTIENKRKAFMHINDFELKRRRQLVATKRNDIRKGREHVREANVDAMLDRYQRERLFSGKESESKTSTRKAGASMTDAYTQDAQVTHQALMEQQDECVDDMLEGLENLKDASEAIGEEIDDQDKALKDMGKNISKAREKFQAINKSLSKFLRTKDHCQVYVLLTLGILAVVLLFCNVWAFMM